MNIHSETFREEFDKVEKQKFDEGNFPEGMQIDSPRTLETLNKTWEDIIVLVAKVNEIATNMSKLHKG